MADRTVPALKSKETLSFFFRSSRSLPLTLFCPLSGEVTKNTFLSVKKTKYKVSGILRELLKQKLSALHATSACSSRLSSPLHGTS